MLWWHQRHRIIGRTIMTSCSPEGVWLISTGSWFMVHGTWFMVHGSWFISYVRIQLSSERWVQGPTHISTSLALHHYYPIATAYVWPVTSAPMFSRQYYRKVVTNHRSTKTKNWSWRTGVNGGEILRFSVKYPPRGKLSIF